MSSERLITVTPQAILINADYRLAFQVLTAFGAQSSGGAATQVLEERGDRRLVRFTTPFSLPGFGTALVTDEWVATTGNTRIDFSLDRGHGIMRTFSALEDSFLLEDQAGMTRMVYESKFRLGGGIIGRLIGNLMVRPLIRKFMVGHLKELKEQIERRAARSKLYPQQRPTG